VIIQVIGAECRSRKGDVGKLDWILKHQWKRMFDIGNVVEIKYKMVAFYTLHFHNRYVQLEVNSTIKM